MKIIWKCAKFNVYSNKEYIMNFSYISGFLDGEGSIMLDKGKLRRYIRVSFSNNELCILESIQKFIEDELGYKGSIIKKPARKAAHNTNYELKYVYRAATCLLEKLELYHPIKNHRKNIACKIGKLIPRNGFYKEELLTEIKNLETKFYEGGESPRVHKISKSCQQK